MTLLEQAQHLQELAHGPQILEAVDTYYADDVQIVEATGETARGRETQKERIREWQSMLKAVHGSTPPVIAAHETAAGTGVVFVETSDDLEFADGTRMVVDEVAVQRWEDGKVVHERFYYTPPPDAAGTAAESAAATAGG